MGIKGILKLLPGGDVQRKKFGSIKILEGRRNPADWDTGTLVVVCGLRHKDEYDAGNFLPSVREFQKSLMLPYFIYKWDIRCIFDGVPPLEKLPEQLRRRVKATGFVLKSTYIAMCVRVCDRYHIPYVVAPKEADMQVGRGRKGAVAVTRDADSVAYDTCDMIVIIDHFGKELYRIINMRTPLTDEIAKRYPLYAFICRYGIKIVHWWGAIRGCDVTENGSGIDGIGEKTIMKALETCAVRKGNRLSDTTFAKVLLDCAGQSVSNRHSVKSIVQQLRYVSTWFTSGGSYYDKTGNEISIDGRLVQRSSGSTRLHMIGRIDPREFRPFTPEQVENLEKVKPHTMLHNSVEDRSKVQGASLPPGRKSLDECSKAELKGMVIARGGNVTGKNGKGLSWGELLKCMKHYSVIERLLPDHASYYNRSKADSGLFSKIDTSHKRTMPQMLRDLAACEGLGPCVRALADDALKLHSDGKFVGDFDTIAQTAPEMDPSFIATEFVAVGNSETQKSMSSSLKRVQEENDCLYHAVAWSKDEKSIYILSKCRASMCKDENTRAKTEAGEKPLPKEYLVILQVMLEATKVESDGHCLGRMVRLMRSYCAACTAGAGLCYHRGMALWRQYHHWGVGRPTPKPATLDRCPWIPGSRGPRSCKVTEPVHCLMCEKAPGTQEEAEERNLCTNARRAVHEGISAKYDIYDGNEDKWAKMKDPAYVSSARMSHLFLCLRKANKTK